MNYFENSRLSRSKLCDLKVSPYYFWSLNIAKNTKIDMPAMKLGRAFHCAVLEPSEWNRLYSVAPKVDKRTKAGKEAYAEFLSSNKEKEIIEDKDYDLIEHLVFEIESYKPALQILHSCDLKEHEYYFNYRGHDLKAKIDGISTKYNILVDLKTVCNSKSECGFVSDLLKYSYAEQVFLYSTAHEIKTGIRPKFLILSISKKEPYEINISDASKFYDYGKYSIDTLIDKYDECIAKWGLDVNIPWRDEEITQLEPPKWCEQLINKETIKGYECE